MDEPRYRIRNWGKAGENAFIPPTNINKNKSRIMYIEDKSSGIVGKARIGRVFFSKTGKTLYYRNMKFQSLKGNGFKSNYYETESGDEFWISGIRKDENNRLYGGNQGVEIDEDIKEEYYKIING